MWTFIAYRVDQKIKTKKVDGLLNRLHVALPAPRDQKLRPACIPDSVLAQKQIIAEKQKKKNQSKQQQQQQEEEEENKNTNKRKLEREIEEEQGDDYVLDLKKNYDIDGDQKYDNIPEMWEGHNIADYIDADILQKLNELEQEEDLRTQSGIYDYKVPELTQTMKDIQSLAKEISEVKIIALKESRVNKQSTKPHMPRTAASQVRGRSVTRLKEQMEKLGVDMNDTENAHFTKTRGRSRSASGPDRKRLRVESVVSHSRGRSSSRPARDEMGVKDFAMQDKLKKVAHKAIKKKVAKKGLKGEADRFIGTKMPRHLFAGKRGVGKTDRR